MNARILDVADPPGAHDETVTALLRLRLSASFVARARPIGLVEHAPPRAGAPSSRAARERQSWARALRDGIDGRPPRAREGDTAHRTGAVHGA